MSTFHTSYNQESYETLGQLMTDLYFPGDWLEFQPGDALEAGHIISFPRPTAQRHPLLFVGP